MKSPPTAKSVEVLTGDCVQLLQHMDSSSVDLVFTSPPYELQRSYGEVEFRKISAEWINWAIEWYSECCRVSRGLVSCVVNGRTTQGQYSLIPERLAIRLQDLGYITPKPCIFHRYGLPGARPSWIRDVYETIVCASSVWPLPWVDNTACGHAPRYSRGGGFTNRQTDGTRNQGKAYPTVRRTMTTNVIHCKVGRGHMGSDLAHDNEAPFPESLAEVFVKTFCPPGGTVLDPFCGSGTTLAVAKRYGRAAIGIDIRRSQADLTRKRIDEVTE